MDIRIDGIRKRVSLGTTDRSVAQLKAKLIKNNSSKIITSSPQTIEEFKTEYLLWAETRKAPNTMTGERTGLKFLQEFLPVKRLDHITPRLADMFFSDLMRKKKYSPARINFYIRTLRSIFSKAVHWQYIASNPFDDIAQIRFELSPPRILETKELHKIFTVARTNFPEWYDILVFYFYTGFRREEAISLKWEAVDFERNIVYARKTKGKKSRAVPMFAPTREILERRRKLPQPFPDLSDSIVSKIFVEIRTAAGIPDITLHDFRRSFASYLAESGISDAWIQRWLGHAKWTTTDDYYLGITDEMHGKLANFLTLIGN